MVLAASTPPAGPTLAFTGLNLVPIVGVGLAAVFVGYGLTRLARRRRPTVDSPGAGND